MYVETGSALMQVAYGFPVVRSWRHPDPACPIELLFLNLEIVSLIYGPGIECIETLVLAYAILSITKTTRLSFSVSFASAYLYYRGRVAEPRKWKEGAKMTKELLVSYLTRHDWFRK